MAERTDDGLLRFSVSLVTQGRHRFYTLTMPSDVLAKTCFVTTRYDDPDVGFQRILDKKRAKAGRNNNYYLVIVSMSELTPASLPF